MATDITPSMAGCWIDGHHGQYAIDILVDTTMGLVGGGETFDFPLTEDESIVSSWCIDRANGIQHHDEPFDGAWEVRHDLADKCEHELNEQLAPIGYSFGWHDGEFFLWSDEDWEECYG